MAYTLDWNWHWKALECFRLCLRSTAGVCVCVFEKWKLLCLLSGSQVNTQPN